MAYEPHKLEEKWSKHWGYIQLIEKRKLKNKRGPRFFYIDGPPYANAPPHAGTATTRAIRECILKYKLMNGFNVWLQPGFDTHGLPVENKVQKELGLKTNADIEKYGIEKYNEACRKHATRHLGLWKEFYEKFGSTSTWDVSNPYFTFENSYISSSWLFFKKAHEQKLLYRGVKTVPWCASCETSLSAHDVTQEYEEIEDVSIYVKFRIKGKKDTYFLVWTTTPWTLPGNVAIALNEKYEYAKVKAGKEYYILARTLVESTMKALGIEVYEIAETVNGGELEGTKYEPILSKEVPNQNAFEHTIVLSDTVNIEEGVGCVHIAPGHGPEDYDIGLEYGLKVLCPVDERGIFTDEAGKYSGKFVFDANLAIIKDLEKGGGLVKTGKIKHRYAHCWRCKNKLIYRASEQWFIKIAPIRELMISKNEKVKWTPDWAGHKRFNEWLVNSRDWCISRQKYWGSPLPFWVCSKCGKFKVIGSFEELKKKGEKVPDDLDLHLPHIDKITMKCSCGGKMHRTKDVADVWFDAGAAPWASMHYPKSKEFKEWFPVSFITESVDQTRGWFYYLFVESAIAFGKAPYNEVLVGGLVLDEKGRKMSKSLGNVVDPAEALNKVGADALRGYFLWNTTPWDNTTFSYENLKIVQNSLNILWNLYLFVQKYYELDKYDKKEHKSSLPEDLWILSRLENAKKKIAKAFDEPNPFIVARSLQTFIVNDLSRDYVKFIRGRLQNSVEKEKAYFTLYKVFEDLTPMLAPVTPFIAEEIYRGLIAKEESVHLEKWPKVDDKKIDVKLEEKVNCAKKIIEGAMNLRNAAGIRLRMPVKALYVVSTNPEVEETVKEFEKIISEQTNVKKIQLGKAPAKKNELQIDGATKIFLDTEVDDGLLADGYTREVIRRIQQMRKEMNLKDDQQISVNTIGPGNFIKYLNEIEIKRRANIKNLKMSNAAVFKGYEKAWKVDEFEFKIVISSEEFFGVGAKKKLPEFKRERGTEHAFD